MRTKGIIYSIIYGPLREIKVVTKRGIILSIIYGPLTQSQLSKEEEVYRVPTTSCEVVNKGNKVDNPLDDIRTTKAWIRNNTNVKDPEELDMPKQDGNLSKWKELARKSIIRLEKYEKKESIGVFKETEEIRQANLQD